MKFLLDESADFPLAKSLSDLPGCNEAWRTRAAQNLVYGCLWHNVAQPSSHDRLRASQPRSNIRSS